MVKVKVMQVELVTAGCLFGRQSLDQFALQIFERPFLRIALILGFSQCFLRLFLEGSFDRQYSL